ncbi:MAG TPA: phosphopentomutase [Blastocatellia bacterium]|nr:phosphopentomutase [Blastocatellia bacterium]
MRVAGERTFRRVALVVLDSVGVGEMPDAARFGDEGSDTLGHVLATREVKVPHLQALGLGNIRELPLPPAPDPRGSFGRAAIASDGKDTTTGHWEMAGLLTETAFPTYPEGFPGRVIGPFEEAVGRRVLGNKAASGTEIIAELGAEHVRTGRPIVYTSADSVFQIAAHEEVVPVAELYRWCEIARGLLQGADRVGRVIARPFLGGPGNFRRTERRHDYAVEPPQPTLADLLRGRGYATISVGKIASIFCHRGFSEELPGSNNGAAVGATVGALQRADWEGLLFTNLVDFDMLHGHRNDVEGYARALEAFDASLPEIYAAMREDDLLVLTADHGCDPTTPSTDHSREYVPVLTYGARARGGVNLGTRDSMADIGQTIAENFGVRLGAGVSFLKGIEC